jgi:hypothetical protein
MNYSDTSGFPGELVFYTDNSKTQSLKNKKEAKEEKGRANTAAQNGSAEQFVYRTCLTVSQGSLWRHRRTLLQRQASAGFSLAVGDSFESAQLVSLRA